MEEGEEGAEIQDQGLAQATAASESRDATEKDSPHLCEVLKQYWVSNVNPPAKCPFLSMYLYKLYLTAEFAVSERTVSCHQIACFPSLRICMP